MARLATLLCLLAAAAASAQAREPGTRVRYRTPAGPPMAILWTEHPVLSAPTPLLAVSERDTTDGGTTAGVFARPTDLGFHRLAPEPAGRRAGGRPPPCGARRPGTGTAGDRAGEGRPLTRAGAHRSAGRPGCTRRP